MLAFDLNLALPERWDPNWADPFYHRWYEHDIKISKNYAWDLDVSRTTWHDLFRFKFDIEFSGRDHAGPGLWITVLGLNFRTHIYRGSHWNYDEKRWYYPGEEAEYFAARNEPETPESI